MVRSNQPKPISWVREGSCIRCTSHALNGRGYASILRGGRKTTIPRWILIRSHGDIPSSVVARHTCDNRWCIRPNHIIAGSIADNNHDRKERGRNAEPRRSERNGNSKLTSTQARQILEASIPYKEISKRFGVSVSCVEKIKARTLWRYL